MRDEVLAAVATQEVGAGHDASPPGSTGAGAADQLTPTRA